MGELSLEKKGYALTALSAIFFLLASYATLFHIVMPPADASVRRPSSSWDAPHQLTISYKILSIIANDTHYKYFFILLIPAGTCFVIANWVGWQYYRNA